MKASKFAYLASLIVFLVLSRIALMIGFMFPKRMFSGDQFRLSSILFLITLGLLIVSYFGENQRLKQGFEVGSLIAGAFFLRAFSLSNAFEIIPLWGRLLFLFSFGLFLYFKLLTYFKREKSPPGSNESSDL